MLRYTDNNRIYSLSAKNKVQTPIERHSLFTPICGGIWKVAVNPDLTSLCVIEYQ